MTRREWRAGLRQRTAVAFAVGAVVVCSVLAGSTYVIAREYLLAQRERGAVRQAVGDARLVAEALRTQGVAPAEALGRAAPAPTAQALLRQGDRWFSSSLDVGPGDLPQSAAATPPGAGPVAMWSRVQGEPALVVTVPLPAAGAVYHEVADLAELDATLRTLRLVLLGVALVTALVAVVAGLDAAVRVVRPLHEVAGAARRVAAGDLTTRLGASPDPDLAAIARSFDGMVDALQARIEREARFAADVSHELRSPLTTLVAGVGLLEARARDLPERERRTVHLVAAELTRFRRVLDDLLELARLDAGVDDEPHEDADLAELVCHAVADSGRAVQVVLPRPAGAPPLPVQVAKRRVERALVNLFDNADSHGGGLEGVHVVAVGPWAQVAVDDRGPGVPGHDRDRIFGRFARGGSRGSQPGTGLGLSLVAETAAAHGGSAWCEERPGGGARFVLQLPLSRGPDA